MRGLVVAGCLLVACASTPAAPPSGGASAPTPTTEADLRAAFPAGSEFRFKIEPAGAPATTSITRFVSVTEADAMIEDETLDANDKTIEPPKQARATWKELLEHGRFPAEKTRITEVEHEGPLGKHACQLYEVDAGAQDGKALLKKLWFAKDLPGPPIQLETWTGGELSMRAVMVLRRKGP